MNAAGHRLLSWYPLLHVAGYQVTWVVALMGGAAGGTWPGLLVGGALLAVHVTLSAARGAVIERLLLATVLGLLVDAALMASGTVAFAGVTGLLPPAWMVILWPCFASLFDDLLAWLPARPALALVCGALGGPLAYLGGQALGAVEFPRGIAAGMSATAVAWTVATAVLVLLWRARSPAREVVP